MTYDRFDDLLWFTVKIILGITFWSYIIFRMILWAYKEGKHAWDQRHIYKGEED